MHRDRRWFIDHHDFVILKYFDDWKVVNREFSTHSIVLDSIAVLDDIRIVDGFSVDGDLLFFESVYLSQ